MKRSVVVVGMGLASVVALGACGAGSSTSEPATYGSVEELKNAAVEAGLDCPDWEKTNQVVNAAQSGQCDGNSVLATYSTDADLQATLDGARDLAELAPIFGTWLVGPNWTINSPQAEELQPRLGGVVEDF